jgi:hypothetical protein
MTVRELIEQLQTLDPELRVFNRGYEAGLDDVNGISKVINVELNHYTEWYYGDHKEVDDEAPNTVKGIVI